MPNTNINKFAAFVILLCGIGTGCSYLSPAQEIPAGRAPYEKPVVTGKLESGDLNEASGIAASKCQQDVYWSHNDSGDDAFVFAIAGNGKHLGTWKVTGASNRDWEDIASYKDPNGKCYVLIGDTGNNELERGEMAIYRIEEPTIDEVSARSSRRESLATAAASSLIFNYPDAKHDAETLLVNSQSGDIYVLTKSKSQPSQVFKLKPEFGEQRQTAVSIAQITVPAVPNGLLTGGDISVDGKRVVLCDDFFGYELELPAGATSFDEIWKQKPLRFDLGKREAGEAVGYSADGRFVIAISEKKNTPVIKVERSVK